MAQHSLVRNEGKSASAGGARLPNPRALVIVSIVTMVVMIASVIASIIYSIAVIDQASIDSEVARAERALQVNLAPGAAPDAALARRLADDYLLGGAHFVAPGANSPDETTVAVPGREDAVLAWVPRRFASEMAIDLTPIRLAASLVFLGGVGFLLRRLYKAATELDQQRRVAQDVAVRDSLTGLGNRLAFERQLARCSETGAALLYLDLDEFKQVNDRLGHGAGDELLKAVASRIAALSGGDDLAARLGGDEFVLLRSRQTSRAELAELATDIGSALAEPVRVGAVDLAVGVSIGIAVMPAHSSDTAGLVEAADAALYRAKALPGHAFVFADDSNLARAA